MSDLISLFNHTFLNFYNFNGRANRKEAWNYIVWSSILMYLCSIYLVNIDFVHNATGGNVFSWLIRTINSLGFAADITNVVLGVIVLILLLPCIALYVRRLHDLNLSGWLLLIGLIPILRLILWIVLLFNKGNEYPNKYGPVPKY